MNLFRSSNCLSCIATATKAEVDDLILFLRIFDDASKKLQKTKVPSIHLVCLYYERLRKHLDPGTADSSIIKMAKENCRIYFNVTIYQ